MGSMPAQPAWISRINHICTELERLPRPFVDRATLEALLQVGRRRAQQILSPCVSDRVGSNGLADRQAVIRRLKDIAAGEVEAFEMARRRKVAGTIEKLRLERIEHPRVLVEAPVRVVSQQIRSLPAGVAIAPGRITVEFAEPKEALEKLLALAMAIGNDWEQFEGITRSVVKQLI
jgi:hypothetical protein